MNPFGERFSNRGPPGLSHSPTPLETPPFTLFLLVLLYSRGGSQMEELENPHSVRRLGELTFDSFLPT